MVISPTWGIRQAIPILRCIAGSSGDERSRRPRQVARSHRSSKAPRDATGAAASFSRADLQVDRVRGMDADVDYMPTRVGPNCMKQVRLPLLLHDGMLRMISFVRTRCGKILRRVTIDARKDDETASTWPWTTWISAI